MPTNAQAALQAAATVYSGGRGNTTPASVKLLADVFKDWLDDHDPPEPEPREVALDALVIPAEPHGTPELHADHRPEPDYPGLRVGFSRR